MYTIGIDLHKRESQLCIQTPEGTFVERRIATTRERLTAVLAPYAPARVLLEAATESEWVARHLEAAGHTVIVTDPNFAPMYATRSRRVKTDKRDARTLCEACVRGTYQPTHRVSEAQRHVRAELTVRTTLVRTRTRCVSVIKAAVRREGLRVSAGTPEHTARKLEALPLSEATRMEVAPLLTLIGTLNTQIDAADARLAVLAQASVPATLLQSMPMIGPVTALGFVAALDDVTRFPSADHVAAYLGLVPSEHSSGDRQRRGHITKRGDTRTRWLLVEAAWRVMRSSNAALAPLQRWTAAIIARRGRRVGIVALARRLATLLYTLWRTGTPYRGASIRSRSAEAAA
ncbi:MAG TPA: IS110 family transposase [Gemmatimonas sp.]|nr:IS110 family transposase [Gemmatimonas sp.]